MSIRDRAERLFAVLEAAPGLLETIGADGKKLTVKTDIIAAIGKSGLEVTKLVADGFMTEPGGGEAIIDINAIRDAVESLSKPHGYQAEPTPKSGAAPMDKAACARLVKDLLKSRSMWSDVDLLRPESSLSAQEIAAQTIIVGSDVVVPLAQDGVDSALLAKYKLATSTSDRLMINLRAIEEALQPPERDRPR